MNVPRIRTQITLDAISWVVQQIGGASGSPNVAFGMYLWTVFFKVDGDTVRINESFNAQGTATVVGTPGDHGDLAGTGDSNLVSIPAANGYFRTVLTPIPVQNFATTVPGALGCVVILMAQNDTPSDAVAQGHQALNSSLQQALDALIPTLGIKNPTVTQDDINAIQQQVSAAVSGAIKDTLTIWDKILTVLDLTVQDSVIGTLIYLFSPTDLTESLPTGILLQNGYQNGQATQTEIQFAVAGAGPFLGPTPFVTLTFQGRVVADPYPLSLTRILARLGLTSVRQAMASTPVPFQPPGSVENWIDAIS